jgi:hypothetical protein
VSQINLLLFFQFFFFRINFKFILQFSPKFRFWDHTLQAVLSLRCVLKYHLRPDATNQAVYVDIFSRWQFQKYFNGKESSCEADYLTDLMSIWK